MATNRITRRSPHGSARTPQFQLYQVLTERGIRCEAEIRLPATSPRSKSGHFFADLGVYRAARLIALCECKSRSRELRGRQRENCDGCGLPYIVAGNDSIEAAADWLTGMVDTGGRAR